MNYRDWGGPSEEHQPVTYWQGHPIYASQFVVIVYCVLMVVVAIGGAAMGPVVYWLGFSSDLVQAGQVWRLFTYGLFNPPTLNFAFDMLMIWWCGRELERFFGRQKFGVLYGGIYLAPTLVLTLLGLWWPTRSLVGEPGALSLFVAFATQFPGMPVFFVLLAQWAAIILVGIFTLSYVYTRNWVELIVLWTTCGYAYAFVRYQQGHLSLPRIRLWKRKPRLRVLPDLPQKKAVPAAKTTKEEANMAEVDALLDKIAQSGIGSLTPKERAKLDAAREGLLKRGSGRG
jgi:membrane associated rhomboid family serine protease